MPELKEALRKGGETSRKKQSERERGGGGGEKKKKKNRRSRKKSQLRSMKQKFPRQTETKDIISGNRKSRSGMSVKEARQGTG